MCDRNCYNCIYTDCIMDDVTREEYVASVKLDAIARNESPHDIDGRQLAIYKYNHSMKGKATQDRYNSSEKGIVNSRRASATYYDTHREEVKAQKRRYYELNKERILAKRKEKRRLARLCQS